MFHQIQLVRYSDREFIYSLTDSCFKERITLLGRNFYHEEFWNYRLALEVIRIYKRRHLNVVRNLILYYKWLTNYIGRQDIRSVILRSHLHSLAVYGGDCEYNKYYPLLRRALK